MDDAPSEEEAGEQLSCDQNDNEEDLELEKAIADDFRSYDCFVKPFHSPDEGEENGKGLKNTPSDQMEQQQNLLVEGVNGDFELKV